MGGLYPVFARCYSAVSSNRSYEFIKPQKSFWFKIYFLRETFESRMKLQDWSKRMSNPSVFGHKNSNWQVDGAALNAVENRLAMLLVRMQ